MKYQWKSWKRVIAAVAAIVLLGTSIPLESLLAAGETAIVTLDKESLIFETTDAQTVALTGITDEDGVVSEAEITEISAADDGIVNIGEDYQLTPVSKGSTELTVTCSYMLTQGEEGSETTSTETATAAVQVEVKAFKDTGLVIQAEPATEAIYPAKVRVWAEVSLEAEEAGVTPVLSIMKDGQAVNVQGEEDGYLLDAGTYELTATVAETGDYKEDTKTIPYTVNVGETGFAAAAQGEAEGKVSAYVGDTVTYTLTSSGVAGSCVINDDAANPVVLDDTNAYTAAYEVNCDTVGDFSFKFTFTPADTNNYTGTEITKNLMVQKLFTVEEAIDSGMPAGKAFDGTSEAAFTTAPSLKTMDPALPAELELVYDAVYYLNGEETYGNVDETVTADSVVLSNLKIMDTAAGTESAYYIFAADSRMEIPGGYEITSNGDFLTFTGMTSDDLGTPVIDTDAEGKEIETYWYNTNKEITKTGFQFGTGWKGKFKDTYTVTGAADVHAKNTDTKAISPAIHVNYDATAPTGSIYATVDGGNAQSITELTGNYAIISQKSDIRISFDGSDAESKIKSIEWYGQDTAKSVNDDSTWPTTGTQFVADVNTGARKEASFTNLEFETIQKTELKKFYYAKVTDFAGNVTYVSSEGVLQDSTIPVVESVQLGTESGTYGERAVYPDTVPFTLNLQETGITSGVADVKVLLQRTTKQDSAALTTIAEYDINSEACAWGGEKLEAIRTLKTTVKPTEEQVAEVSTTGTDVLTLTGTLSGLADGNYYVLTVVAADKAGNESVAVQKEFIVDTVQPEVNITMDMNTNAAVVQDAAYPDGIHTKGTVTVTVKDMTLTTQDTALLSGVDGETWITVTADDGLVTKTAILSFGEAADAVYKEGGYALTASAEDSLSAGMAVTANKKFLIDYTAPMYTVTYSGTDENAISEGNKLYYNQDIQAEFTLTEDSSFDDSLVEIKVANAEGEDVITWSEGAKIVKGGNYVLTHEAGTKTFIVCVKADASAHTTDNDGYTFTLSAQDKAGNMLTAENETDTQELQKVRAMDTLCPDLTEVAYDTADAFHTVTDKDYVNADTTITYTIEEHNPITSKASVTSSAEEMECEWTGETDTYTTSLLVPQFGEKGDEQTARLTILDKAGNKAVMTADKRSEKNTTFEDGVFTDKFTVDKVVPVISYEYLSINPDRPNVEGIDYFRQPITVRIMVDEHNFHETEILEKVENYSPAISLEEPEWISEEDIHTIEYAFTEDSLYDISVNGADCALNPLNLTPTDKMAVTGNAEEGTTQLAVAVDKTLPQIGDTDKPVVVVRPSSPNGTETENGAALYNSDVTFQVVVYDPLNNDFCSGINGITFKVVGETGAEATCTVDKNGTIHNGTGLTVAATKMDAAGLAKGKENRYEFAVTISADVFNMNGLKLSVEAEDVSTNVKKTDAKEVAIDTTAPTVEISYDNNEVSHDKYFKADRTATVRVTERNFSDDCLQFLVNGGDRHLTFQQISAGSGNRDNAVWQASYTFDEDGDYTVSCDVTDRADNNGSASYIGEAPQDFTIDKTAPVITVTFDNNNAQNTDYFDAQRIATITIEEHNFKADEVEITGSATDDGAEIAYPPTSAWSSNGDINQATITYAADALYTLDVEYTDMAANPAIPPETSKFTVDNIDPEITITGVEEGMPYPDEVLPVISFGDTNYEDYQITLTRTEREQHGVDVTEEFVGAASVSVNENGRGDGHKRIEDLEHVQENDGIYTLSVTVHDKAGRTSEESVTYSVNRFGSVYVYSEDLAKLSKGYHQKIDGDLYISVYNANALVEDSTKLEINCDGSAVENQKTEAVVAEAAQPHEQGWYEYQFDLEHADFAEDGGYEITFSDRDEAGNTRTNSDHPIQFFIDATAPLLDSVVGLEKAIVNADSQTVQYVTSDAIGLQEVSVYVDGEEVDHIEEFATATLHDGSFVVGEGMRQNVRIVVADKAGNILDTSEESFVPAFGFTSELTVSKNIFVRWYANTSLFWGSIAGAGVVLGLLILLLVLKKRKKEETEEE